MIEQKQEGRKYFGVKQNIIVDVYTCSSDEREAFHGSVKKIRLEKFEIYEASEWSFYYGRVEIHLFNGGFISLLKDSFIPEEDFFADTTLEENP